MTSTISLSLDSSLKANVAERLPLSDIQQRVRAVLDSRNFFNWRGNVHEAVATDLRNISNDALLTVLMDYFDEFNKTEAHTDASFEILEDLAKVIPLQKMEACLTKESFTTALSMLQAAKQHFEKTAVASPTFKTRVRNFFEALIAVLESILNAFGIADFLKPSEGEMSNNFRFQKIMMQLSLFTILLTSLSPLCGPANAGFYVGSSFAGLWILSILWRYIKPIPSHLSKCENWSHEARYRRLKAPAGREGIPAKIKDALVADTSPVLLGESGIGKTQSAMAFVISVERGDFPELAGKECFYVDAAQLVNSKEPLGGGNRILERLKDEIGRHKDNVILIIDEFHVLFKQDGILGDQIKLYLSTVFKHVVGLTTSREYREVILKNNHAMERRIPPIPIDRAEQTETVNLASAYVLTECPNAILREGTLDALYKGSHEELQPGFSLDILSQCIKLTSSSRKSPLEDEIADLEAQLKTLGSKEAVEDFEPSLQVDQSKEFTRIQGEIKKKKEALAEERAAIQKLYQIKERLYQLKIARYKTVVAIGDVNPDILTPAQRVERVKLLLLNYVLKPSLEKELKTRSEQLKVKLVIDKELIGEVTKKEIQSRAQSREIIARGQGHGTESKRN